MSFGYEKPFPPFCRGDSACDKLVDAMGSLVVFVCICFYLTFENLLPLGSVCLLFNCGDSRQNKPERRNGEERSSHTLSAELG
jgi:hypothetical protein